MMSKIRSENAMTELPMGFGMALLQNRQAQRVYDSLPLGAQMEILNGTHGIRSKAEMRDYVARIPSME